MFNNLNAEQARIGLTDEAVAEKMGISRQTYLSKKKSGKFTVPQIRMLLSMFNVSFDYLFATESEAKR